jgi:hypothetical protein
MKTTLTTKQTLRRLRLRYECITSNSGKNFHQTLPLGDVYRFNDRELQLILLDPKNVHLA